jgi:hypothetical protein
VPPKILKRESVIEALSECQRLGRERFLERYGFGKSVDYELEYNGQRFDSKAIFGVAFGIEHPRSGPLRSVEFTGGLSYVVPQLRALGFEIKPVRAYDASTSSAFGPIILVQNERTEGGRYDHWEDVPGERYHFPNKYVNLVTPGRPFIYYQGKRRAGGKEGRPQYFGCGAIGDVVRDDRQGEFEPKSTRRWFATIDDFIPFLETVPAKSEGKYLERIAQNHWGYVRPLPYQTYELILAMAHVERLRSLAPSELIRDAPALEQVHPRLVDNPGSLLAKSAEFGPSNLGRSTARVSRFAKAIGDRAEEIVFESLRLRLSSRERESLQWPARDGQTPGWDIQFVSGGGVLRRIEVKGTQGPQFPSFEMTANEWMAATRHRSSYAVHLVAHCLSAGPSIDELDDPVGLHERGALSAAPSRWRVGKA